MKRISGAPNLWRPLEKRKMRGKVNENSGNTRERRHKGGRVKISRMRKRFELDQEKKTYQRSDRVNVLGLVCEK